MHRETTSSASVPSDGLCTSGEATPLDRSVVVVFDDCEDEFEFDRDDEPLPPVERPTPAVVSIGINMRWLNGGSGNGSIEIARLVTGAALATPTGPPDPINSTPPPAPDTP